MRIVAPRTLFRPVAQHASEGLTTEYFGGKDFGGRPIVRRVDKQIDFDWSAASPVPGVPLDASLFAAP